MARHIIFLGLTALALGLIALSAPIVFEGPPLSHFFEYAVPAFIREYSVASVFTLSVAVILFGMSHARQMRAVNVSLLSKFRTYAERIACRTDLSGTRSEIAV